jgi:hypothetical protein
MSNQQTRVERDSDTREVFKRAEEWKPAGLLPEFKKSPGWAYRWVRVSLLNQADNLNVSSKMREGWEPVNIADHPELKYMVDKEPKLKDSIEIGGLVLCKMPEEFIEQRKAYYRNRTEAQTQAVDNSFMKQNDARMPLFSEKKSEVRRFGKG